MDNRKVLRSAWTVGFFVLLSRAFGLIRDMAMAALFGSYPAMDAFVVAYTIPNLFRGLFGEGALSSAFVPVFTETLKRDGAARVWPFARAMFSVLTVLLTGLVAVGLLLTLGALRFFPLGERAALIAALTGIMLPYVFLVCQAAFFSAMLNALHRFVLPALAPVVLNLVMIASLWLVCGRLDVAGGTAVRALAWSVVVAGIVQWGMQLPALHRQGFRLGFTWAWGDTGVRRVGQLMGAAIVGVGITQLNVVLDRYIAVAVGPGCPSYLYYAERLIYFPLGIFATALGTVLLPAFAGHAAAARPDRMRETLQHALRNLMFVMLPAAVGLFVLAEPIVRLVYERGRFSPHTTDMTTLAVMCYAPGLLVFSLLKVLVPVFYGLQDMKTPVRVGLWCVGVNVVLKLILMWPMRHAGIALATVLSSAVNVTLLAWLAHRRIGSPGWGQVGGAALRMTAAALVMACAATHTYSTVARWAIACLTSPWDQVAAVGTALAVGVVVYGLTAVAARCPEAAECWRALRRRQPSG